MALRRIFSGTIIAAVALALFAVAAPSASARPSQESEFVSHINAERRKIGARALSVRTDLVTVARRHSKRMAAKGGIWHNPNLPNEVDGWTRLGENVGYGHTVEWLHDAFMDSPGHRKNILNRAYNQVGIGIVRDADGMIFVTQVFAQRGGVQGSSYGSKSTSSREANAKSTSSRKAKSKSAPKAKSAPKPKKQAPKPTPKKAEPAAQERSESPQALDLLVRMVDLDGSN